MNRNRIISLSSSTSSFLYRGILSRSSSLSLSHPLRSSRFFSSFTKKNRVSTTSTTLSFKNSSSSLLFRSTSTVIGGCVVATIYYGISFFSRVVHNESHLSVSRIHASGRSIIPYDTDNQEFTFIKNATSDLEITGASEDPLQIKVGTSLYDNPIDTLIRRIGKGKYSIQAVVYKFDNDQIYTSLSDALSRGVKVQLICDSKENKKPKSKAYRLRAEGALVEFWDYNRLKKLHAKFTIVDSEYVLSGSSNWTKNADNDNMELVLEFNGNVKEFSHTFEDMWALAGGRIGIY